MQLRRLLLLVTSVSVAGLGVLGCTTQRDFEAEAQAPAPVATPQRRPDVPYVPTPQPVVDAMLQLAQVNSNDVVYDLGSGDGRIPITAAQKYGI